MSPGLMHINRRIKAVAHWNPVLGDPLSLPTIRHGIKARSAVVINPDSRQPRLAETNHVTKLSPGTQRTKWMSPKVALANLAWMSTRYG